MKSVVTPDDQVVLRRLLTELADRVESAVDFWPLVCLGLEDFLFDPHRFLDENTETLSSLVVVLRALLAKAALADEEPFRVTLQQMLSQRSEERRVGK